MFGKIRKSVEDKVKIVASKTAVSTIKEYLPVLKVIVLGMIFLGSTATPAQAQEPIVNVFVGGTRHA